MLNETEPDDENGIGGDGEFCEHGNLIDEEFCDECADAHWKLSDSFGKVAVDAKG